MMGLLSEWLFPRINVGAADEDYLSQVVTEGSLSDLAVLFTDVGLMVERAAVDLWRNIRITQEGDDRRWSDWHAQMLRAGMMFYECLDGLSPIAAFAGYRHGFSTRAIATKMQVSQTSVRRWITEEQQRRRPPAQEVFRRRWDIVTPPAEWGYPYGGRAVLFDDAEMPDPGGLSRREGLPSEPRPEESVRRSAPVMREYRPVHRLTHAAENPFGAAEGVVKLHAGTISLDNVDSNLLKSPGRARNSCAKAMAREICVASNFYFSQRHLADELRLSHHAVARWRAYGVKTDSIDVAMYKRWQNGENVRLPPTWIDQHAEETYRQFLEAGGWLAARPAPPFFDRLEEPEQPAAR